MHTSSVWEFLFSLNPHNWLVLSYLPYANLHRMKWHPVVWVSICLITSEGEHLFMFLLANWVSYPFNCVSISFDQIVLHLLAFFLWLVHYIIMHVYLCISLYTDINRHIYLFAPYIQTKQTNLFMVLFF